MNTLELADLIIVCIASDFTEAMARNYSLVVFDEFDFSIDNQMFTSKAATIDMMKGFFNAVFCDKVILVSATYSGSCDNIMKAMFKNPPVLEIESLQ